MAEQGELIPFGKYKGQPVEVLGADPDYAEWLQGQGWVRERYPQLFAVIINNLGEVADTPEHNAMQALFLDRDLCIQTGRHFLTYHSDSGKEWADRYYSTMEHVFVAYQVLSGFGGRRFETDDGADVTIHYRSQALIITAEKSKYGALETRHRNDSQTYIASIELKPSLGDDYPGILRSVVRLNGHWKCVVYQSYVGIGATIDQVKAMFWQSGVVLVSLDELRAYSAYMP